MSFTPGAGAVISFSVEGAQSAQRQIESIGTSMHDLSSTAKASLKELAAFAGVGLSLGALADKVLGAQREFDKLNASLVTATGSTADAAAAFKSLQAFAASTPYSVADATEAFIKMKNLGLDPSEKALRSYGNTAAAMGKGLDQMIEAVADAATGEFERLKEFGITSKQSGDKVALTFKGITTTIGKNADEIQAYLKKLGDTDFAGAMAMRADTLDGAISNLGDSWDAFLLKMSQSGLGDAAKNGVVMLANNLQALAGVIGTVAAARLGSTFATWAAETYKQVAASVALRAATVAEMEAEVAGTAAKVGQLGATQSMVVVAREEAMSKLASANANIASAETAIAAATAAGTQSFALRTVRLATAELATAEAARAAMLAELAVLGRQQASVSAQLTAARLAEKAAQDALNTSTGVGALATGVASRALGLLGGPVGALITVLGLAATAWSVWGRSAQDSSKQAAESYEEAHKRIVKGLDEQIAKNQKLVQLQNLGMTKPQIDRNQPVLEQLAAASKRLNDINSRTGEYALGAGKSNTDLLFDRMKVMQHIVDLTAKMKKGDELAALAATGSTEAMIAVRERLTGVNQQYTDDLEKLQAAYEKGEVKLPEYTAAVSKLATETFKNSTAGKDSAEAIDANIAAMKRRDQVADVLTQRELARIAAERDTGGLTEVDAINETAAAELAAFDRKAGLISREMVLTKQKVGTAMELAAKQADLEGQLAGVAAERRNRQLQQMYELAAIGQKVQSEVTKYIADSTAARDEASTSLDVEYAMYGKTADARAMAMVAVDAETWKEKELAKLREEKKPITDQILNQLDAEKRARILVGEATLGQGKALQYASELAEENRRFGLEYISDDKQRAAAQLAIDANLWRERIRLAGEGTEAQKLLLQEYSTWHQNQLLKPELDASKKMWESVEQTAHDTFISIFDSGKSAFDRLRDALKNGLLDLLYQMTVKKWIFNIQAAVTGSTAAGAASVTGTAASGTTAAGALTNAAGGLSAAGSLYNLYNSSVVGQFMSGLSGSASAASAALGGAELTTAASAGASVAGVGSSITSAIAAIPGWGWAALGAAAIGAYLMNDGPEKDTRLTFTSNNAPGNISINERGNEGKVGQSYIDGYGTSSLGTFGLSSTFWMDGRQSVVQDFIKTVSKTDDALSQFMSATEKASVSSYLTGKSMTVHTGEEGSNPNAKGQLDSVFKDRISNILSGLEPGLASLVAGFKGTSQELASETSQILEYRAALRGAGEAVFGAKVTLQEIAALKTPTELTSAALARITNEFNATNTVALSLGKTTAEAFGQVGLASIGTREQLISAAGGLDALTAKSSQFAQDYLTEAERSAPVLKQVTAQMEALGYAGIVTRDQFKDLVRGLDLTTSEGATTYGKLMDVAAAFAQVHPDTTKQSRVLEIQIMGLLGDKAGELAANRALELSSMDESLRPLQKRVYALQDEAAARVLEIQIMGLSGDKAGELAANRAIELANMDESLRPLQQRIYAFQDEAKALETSNSLLAIQAQIYELTGDKAGAAAALAQQHAKALADLDPALRGATQQLWDLQAAAKSIDKVKSDGSALLNNVDNAFSVLQGIVGREKDLLQKRIDKETEAVNRLKSLTDSISSTLDSFKVPGTEVAMRQAAQAQIKAALGVVKDGGQLSDDQVKSLTKAFSTVTQDATEQFSSYSDYLRDRLQTKNDISALGDITGSQLSAQQSQLDLDKAQVEQYDLMLAKAQEQVNILKGINTTGMGIEQALQGLGTAILAAKGNASVAGVSAIGATYQSALGRAPDAAGLEYWQNLAAGGTSLSAITDAISNSAEAQVQKLYKDLFNRPADAAGLKYWLGTGSSIDAVRAQMMQSDEYKTQHPIAVGTNVTPVANNQALMARLSSPAGNNEALVAEIKALRDEVKQLREANSAENRAIAKGAQQTAEHLDAAINGDTPLATKVIPA